MNHAEFDLFMGLLTDEDCRHAWARDEWLQTVALADLDDAYRAVVSVLCRASTVTPQAAAVALERGHHESIKYGVYESVVSAFLRDVFPPPPPNGPPCVYCGKPTFEELAGMGYDHHPRCHPDTFENRRARGET